MKEELEILKTRAQACRASVPLALRAVPAIAEARSLIDDLIKYAERAHAKANK